MPFDASRARVKRNSFAKKSRANNFQSNTTQTQRSARNTFTSGSLNNTADNSATSDRVSFEHKRFKDSQEHSRFSKRNEGKHEGRLNKSAKFARNEDSANSVDKETSRKLRVPRRKEITNERQHRGPGFSTFQLRLVQSILHTCLVDGKPLDKSYAIWFAKVKIPATEQGFIIKHINAMFRRLSFFAHVASLKRPSDFQRNVNRLILSYYATEGWPLPELNAEGFDRAGLKKRIAEAQEYPLLNEGCPYWLEELCSRELKEAWPAERKALGEVAPRFIRNNSLKITRDELAQRLSAEGVVTKSVKGVHSALEVTSNAALFRTISFREGLFEQQDAGSQLIAPFLEVEAGMRVIDACAGAGGKTLHLASLMQNKGTLIALDIEAWKLEDLKKRAKRAGISNIDTRVIDTTKVVKRLYEHADRVLIDAPCSGLGVLRRTVDSKWSDIQPRLVELKKTQAEILERYSLMAKVGGKVVYSTCSILPSENEKQVAAFLEKHGDKFALEAEHHVWPSSGFDGFYMARLKRIA